jgi:hypothetical protein
MIKKTENCLYCGEKMESVTAKKKFCSDLHRVYWNREQKFEKILTDTLKENEVEMGKVANDILHLGMAATKTDGITMKRVDPLSPEVSAALYNSEHTDSQITVKTIPAFPTKFNDLLAMAKKGVEDKEVFIAWVKGRGLPFNQQTLIINKIKE